jgi:hypothetical protein
MPRAEGAGKGLKPTCRGMRSMIGICLRRLACFAVLDQTESDGYVSTPPRHGCKRELLRMEIGPALDAMYLIQNDPTTKPDNGYPGQGQTTTEVSQPWRQLFVDKT